MSDKAELTCEDIDQLDGTEEDFKEVPIDMKIIYKKQKKLTADIFDELVDDLEKIYEAYYHFETGKRIQNVAEVK